MGIILKAAVILGGSAGMLACCFSLMQATKTFIETAFH